MLVHAPHGLGPLSPPAGPVLSGSISTCLRGERAGAALTHGAWTQDTGGVGSRIPAKPAESTYPIQTLVPSDSLRGPTLSCFVNATHPQLLSLRDGFTPPLLSARLPHSGAQRPPGCLPSYLSLGVHTQMVPSGGLGIWVLSLQGHHPTTRGSLLSLK